MGKSVELKAFAKVNLSLNITGKREDGMHLLDSVMMSVDKFDTVTVSERADSRINVKFIGCDVGEDNTAYKAAKSVLDVIGGGVDITVEKGIPMGAGLGGSSADGAAVLRALDLFYKLPERGVDMRKAALSVGSDVPFMLTGGLARVTGVGEELFFIENKIKAFMVGLMPGFVSTAAAYRAFDEIHGEKYLPVNNDAFCEKLLGGEQIDREFLGNALFEPAVKLLPEIERARNLLLSCGAATCMTGSGGMVVGYFTDIAEFVKCAGALCGERGFTVFAPAPTGILHKWINR